MLDSAFSLTGLCFAKTNRNNVDSKYILNICQSICFYNIFISKPCAYMWIHRRNSISVLQSNFGTFIYFRVVKCDNGTLTIYRWFFPLKPGYIEDVPWFLHIFPEFPYIFPISRNFPMKISGQKDAERCWKTSGAPEVRAQLCARANTHQVKAFDQGLCAGEGKGKRRLDKNEPSIQDGAPKIAFSCLISVALW